MLGALRRGRSEAGFTATQQTWITDNCQFGMPAANPAAGLGVMRVIAREGYVAGHSDDAKIPYWVCERSKASELDGPGDRDRSNFKADPFLTGFPRAELGDYKGSGYDRGHMHPAGNAKITQQMMDETHFLSNMIPQYGPTFNQGIWAHLEDTIRKWTRDRGECWIISGPMFYDPLEEHPESADGVVPYFTVGEGDVAVPTHCYKIVLAKNDGNEWEAIAFVLANQRYAKPYRLHLYLTTIDWIEERTGLDFFPGMRSDPSTAALEGPLEATKASLWSTN